MKKLIGACFAATLFATSAIGPVGAATPPDYTEALDCVFGGLTNGPDSDPDMVAAMMLTFEAAAAEADGDYLAAIDLLDDAHDLLEDAEDTVPIDCTGAIAASARDLAVYTVDLWDEAGGKDKDVAHANKHIAKGDKHQAKGKPDKAIKEYRKAIEHAVEGLDDI